LGLYFRCLISLATFENWYYLERTKFYRRSTAYFESGVLKLYSEPLQNIVKNEGEIRLLMDWQGFTNNRDLKELQKLHDSEYRTQYIRRTLQEFLAGLEDSSFSSTEILAELVRLGILKIKLVKMEERRAIYHKKTGILSDRLDNHILHEGSDNFTRAAHSRNAESVTFLYYSDPIDLDAIKESIIEFDEEWHDNELTFDLSQEFLAQIIAERDRRQKSKQPVIRSITPSELPSGETTSVEITGSNLDRVETIQPHDNDLVKVTIDSREPDRIIGQVEIAPDHPPTSLNKLKVKTATGIYDVSSEKPLSVSFDLKIPEFSEIEGFKQAVELILAGKHGQPQDFLYWLAMQRPHLLRVKESGILDKLVDRGILFEHQKSGAQHCLRVMQDFGVAVCADAVGLGKTRLAAAVAKLYCHEKGQAKVAIVAAKKLHDNWEREMTELGFRGNHLDYELYNKNLMSLKGNRFLDDFNRYGGADLIVIDEAHEGIRNYRNRIHQICLQIQQSDRAKDRERHFLLLTATPWNNRREDIYNILSPFLSRPEGFKDLNFPPEVALWFERRDAGVENFTDNTNLFRRAYRELFLQRTRQMLREATPDLNLYAKRVAEWLPVVFEPDTEQALDQIFTQFETNLYIPSADPIRYLKGSTEQRSLLANQRRFFLQRAESSMYALGRTIKNFSDRIREVKDRLENVAPDADGLKEFLLIHYKFEFKKRDEQLDLLDLMDMDEDYLEEDEDEQESNENKEEKRQKLLNSKVREIVSQGHKVLLISTFSDTVIDYYRYMAKDNAISLRGIGMAIGSSKLYYKSDLDQPSIALFCHSRQKNNRKEPQK
jgi:hypothetical protein